MSEPCSRAEHINGLLEVDVAESSNQVHSI